VAAASGAWRGGNALRAEATADRPAIGCKRAANDAAATCDQQENDAAAANGAICDRLGNGASVAPPAISEAANGARSQTETGCAAPTTATTSRPCTGTCSRCGAICSKAKAPSSDQPHPTSTLHTDWGLSLPPPATSYPNRRSNWGTPALSSSPYLFHVSCQLVNWGLKKNIHMKNENYQLSFSLFISY
jgi:hypothetical protein